MTLQEILDKIQDLIPSNQTREISAADLRSILDDIANYVSDNALSVIEVTLTGAVNGQIYTHGLETSGLDYIFIKSNGLRDYNIIGINHKDSSDIFNEVLLQMPDNGDGNPAYTFTGTMYIVNLNPVNIVDTDPDVKWEKKPTFSSITGLVDKTIYEVVSDESKGGVGSYYFSNGIDLYFISPYESNHEAITCSSYAEMLSKLVGVNSKDFLILFDENKNMENTTYKYFINGSEAVLMWMASIKEEI